jgi:hypothetical protein
MTIPFYTGNIHEPLQQMIQEADNNGDFQPVLDYCEPLIDTTQDDGVLLCYTFALMETALAIHVDDVEETGNNCLKNLERLQHLYGGTDAWKKTIKKIIRVAKNRKKGERQILSKPIEDLTTKEKVNLAYQLAEKGGIENNAKAALLHLELMQKNENVSDEPYHYGQYIICLYRSNQTSLADKTFDEFLIWHSNQENKSYAQFIALCYEEKLCNYINDKAMIQNIWEVANLDKIVAQYDFPLADSVQDELIIASEKFGLIEIKRKLIELIKSTRKPRMIPKEVKKIIGI